MDSPITDIQSIADVQQLAISGFTDWKHFGEVNVSKRGDLLLFNYSQMAQFEGRWNFFERVSRGLIINCKTGEIVARPFDKFFNWLEGWRKARGHIVSVTEKLDGSLGILWRDVDGYCVSTRGSFEGEQARWATQYLHDYFDLDGLPDELTLLFEIIYPENRVVVNYGAREDLVLLAARNRFTGDYLPFFPQVFQLAQTYGFSLPQVHQFNDVGEIIVQTGIIDVAQEGWVAEFSDGSRFKFKGDRYKELQRVIIGLTFKNTLTAVMNGSLKGMLDIIPDEFMDKVNGWIRIIETRVNDVKTQVEVIFADAPTETRKDFALWVMENHAKVSSYLFARYDGKPLEPLIYKETDWSQLVEDDEAKIQEE